MSLFKRETGPVSGLGRLFLSVWVLGMIVGLTLGGGLIWAIIHFAHKYW